MLPNSLILSDPTMLPNGPIEKGIKELFNNGLNPSIKFNNFVRILKESNAVISGGYILSKYSKFNQLPHEANNIIRDIDIYVNYRNVNNLYNFLK
jgi:hypothetical protein